MAISDTMEYGQPIVSILQFMKMKPEHHFKLNNLLLGLITLNEHDQ